MTMKAKNNIASPIHADSLLAEVTNRSNTATARNKTMHASVMPLLDQKSAH